MARIALWLLEQRFGRLVVVGESDKRHNSGSKVWLCECDCGTRLEIPARYLLQGSTKSCGCLRREIGHRSGTESPAFKHGHTSKGMLMSPNALWLLERRFGRLVVVGESEKRTDYGSKLWWCECDCGKRVEVPAAYLTSGDKKSCGCLRRELVKPGPNHPSFRHGHTASKTYTSYRAMIARCYNEMSPSFPYYGAKGVRVCRRWKNCFANFLADMGERPEGKTLDRKDPFKNYSPQNCKWSSREEQDTNKRSNHLDVLEEDLTPVDF